MTAPHSNAIFERIKSFLGVLLLLFLGGCAVYFPAPVMHDRTARLSENQFIAGDGTTLPLRRFTAANPRAIVIALHGFNDYSNAFAGIGAFLQKNGVTVLAYDQRGFGANRNAGKWAGSDAMAQDVRTLARLVRASQPNLPVYILGDSMGGAVTIAAVTAEPAPDIAGIILVAPAVWGRTAMNPLQVMALWFSAHAMPWMHLSAKSLHLKPSDNDDMLRALSADPLVLKNARTDTLYGMTDLMDLALERGADLRVPTLLLYGGRDDIIPKSAMRALLQRLGSAPRPMKLVYYPENYHMLLRDRTGPEIWADILAWMKDKENFQSARGKTVLPPQFPFTRL